MCDLEHLLSQIFLHSHLSHLSFFSNSGEVRVWVRVPGLGIRVSGGWGMLLTAGHGGRVGGGKPTR
jgi:hypothetical protein